MSGVTPGRCAFFKRIFKGIGRFIKKTGKAFKKVWPIALAATAIFFTTGAAFGLMSWGKVASTLVTKVGIKGTLGKVLTGSIAGSGWGAAIGGGVSAATGGSFTEGARSGALSGAITGGLAGAAGWTPGGAGSQNGASSPTGRPGFGTPAERQLRRVAEAAGNTARGAKVRPGGGNSLIGFLKGTGKWVEKNPVIAGNLISGVGRGIGSGMAARSQAEMAEAERQAFDDRLAQLSDNYRVSREALGLPPLEQQVATPSLAETAVPDVAARTEVDPLQISAGGPLSPAEEMRRRARQYPNSLVARGLGVG